MKSKQLLLEEAMEKLNKQESSIQKKKEDIKKAIEEEKNKNKPKSIIDRIKTFTDIIKIGKPSKEALAIINYKGNDPLVLFARDFTTLGFMSRQPSFSIIRPLVTTERMRRLLSDFVLKRRTARWTRLENSYLNTREQSLQDSFKK